MEPTKVASSSSADQGVQREWFPTVYFSLGTIRHLKQLISNTDKEYRKSQSPSDNNTSLPFLHRILPEFQVLVMSRLLDDVTNII